MFFRFPNATRAHNEQKHSLLQRVTPLVVQAEAERGCEDVQPRRRPLKQDQSANMPKGMHPLKQKEMKNTQQLAYAASASEDKLAETASSQQSQRAARL